MEGREGPAIPSNEMQMAKAVTNWLREALLKEFPLPVASQVPLLRG